MSLQDMPVVETDRVDMDSKWFELYQKGIELGTWDVSKLVDAIGVEEDMAVWGSLEPEEKEQWARLIAAFVDLEHAAAEAVHKLNERL
ncbi:hypothetical protein SAMN05216218_11451 [Halorientalis regularis]|uniref:Uncharacterized protein n=2 Tax=Halorientalis regularis TaxID=660518 RepID=A0A1G7R6R5_9EURY|nr:hypothetical protein SAMN05216218_11451 [Halorientalis regularis]